MYDKFFVIGCTMSGVTSIVNNYRVLKNETKTKFRNEKINNKEINFNEIKKGSIFKVPASLPLDDIQNVINESRKYNSLFIFIYRQNFFEKALAWYDWHVDNKTLDVKYISNWIDTVKKTETNVYNLLSESNVDLKTLTYEDIYINSYDVMIEKLKLFDLNINKETAKLFRYTRIYNTTDNTLNGNYKWKPEIDIHKHKLGFDICYDMLCDERIEFL